MVGHCEINPLRKFYCPGKYYPWKALMKGLQTNPRKYLLKVLSIGFFILFFEE
jgi:N-acetyl-anhydromuramyl-L-alanine amidase AmpD